MASRSLVQGRHSLFQGATGVLVVVAFATVSLIPTSLPAQHVANGPDEHLLRAVYSFEGPGFAATMRAANRTAWPVFIGSAPAAWGLAGILDDSDDRWEYPYELTLTVVGTALVVKGLKSLVRRPRPYASLPGIVSRSAAHGADAAPRDPHSFPSGHASLAFSLATSTALNARRWYVAVPVYVWATAVGTSRMWLGLHYPSDVLAGAALGAGIAVLVHVAAQHITPSSLRTDQVSTSAAFVAVRLRL